eukprot:8345336-Lingulodinium_polyedra.AAC.1
MLSDLRLKVNGGLTRFNDMVRLMLKISKNEAASRDQQRGYRDRDIHARPWDQDSWSSYDDYYEEDWENSDWLQ